MVAMPSSMIGLIAMKEGKLSRKLLLDMCALAVRALGLTAMGLDPRQVLFEPVV